MVRRWSWITFAAGRGLAAFLALFSLLNVLGDRFTPGFDANLWWIDLRLLPRVLANLLLSGFAAGLMAWLVRPSSRRCRGVALAVTCLMAFAALVNLAGVVRLALARRISLGFPIPFSLGVLVCLALIAGAVLMSVPAASARGRVVWAAAFGGCFIAFPLAQMVCFGKTDYRQRADAAVVFGARAYADGTPSQALADRVRTACELYREGLVEKLVFSGGPGDGDFDEPATMRRFALSLGVKDRDIVLDHGGLNTAATVADTLPIFSKLGAKRVLAVSHAYHLPRVKMAYQRAGFDVYTVPAQETRTLSAMPRLVAREVAALWLYYLSPLIGHSLQERA